jgi:hypothetical protein
MASFLGSLSGAIWGSCVCQALSWGGQWKVALVAAVDSRVEFEAALARLGSAAGLRKQLLPVFLLEEARAQAFSDTPHECLRVLYEALQINPIWPFGSRDEFAHFYSNRYAIDLIQAGPYKERFQEQISEELAAKAYLNEEPLLQLFNEWIWLNASRIANLDELVNYWFSTLAARNPDEPFIWVYWADALKIPPLTAANSIIASESGGGAAEQPFLATAILRAAMEKCETALVMAPQYSVIGARLSGMDLVIKAREAASSPDEDPLKELRHVEYLKRFTQEYMPDHTGKHILPWVSKAIGETSDNGNSNSPSAHAARGPRPKSGNSKRPRRRRRR